MGRFWRPEVLGCSICPSPSEVLARTTGGKTPTKEKDSGAAKWEGRGADGKKPQNPKFIEMADGRGGVERAETARVLSKALKVRAGNAMRGGPFADTSCTALLYARD